MSDGSPMTCPPSSRQSEASGPGEPSATEARASLSAADKLKPSLAELRVLRQFEDEPAHFAAWIAEHAEVSRDDA